MSKQWQYDAVTGILLNPPKSPETGSKAYYLASNRTWALSAWALYPDGSSASRLKVVMDDPEMSQRGWEEEAERMEQELILLWESRD